MVVIALVAGVLVAPASSGAAGTGGGNPYAGIPVEELTDEQIADSLADYAGGIEALEQTGSLLEGVPPEHREKVLDLAEKIQSQEGRLELAAEIRGVETDPAIQAEMAGDDEAVDDIEVPTQGMAEQPPVSGDTSPDVTVDPLSGGAGKGGQSGSGDDLGPLAGCVDQATPDGGSEAPQRRDSEGDNPREGETPRCPEMPPPPHPDCPSVTNQGDPDAAPGAVLSPTHDSFIGNSPFPVYNGTVDVLTGTDGEPWAKVTVLLEDPKKDFPVGALDVRVWLKTSIGDHAGTPYHARYPTAGAPAGSGVACFESSALTGNRGLATVMVPLRAVSDPGFQLHAEVIEWDPWFQPFSNQFDLFLSPFGPQYWAAGSQVMVHVGNRPMTNRTPFTPAVGAWADRTLFVDENFNPNDDLESTLVNLGKSQITSFLSDYQTEDLVGQWAYDALTPKQFTDWSWDGEGQASFSWDSDNPPNAVQWTGLVFGGLLAQLIDLLASFKITKIAPGSVGLDLSWAGVPGNIGPDSDSAIRAGASLGGSRVEGKLRFLGAFWCKGSLKVKTNASFQAWVEEGSPATSLRTHGAGSFSNLEASDIWMPWYNWLRPNCVAGWLLAKLIAKGVAQKALTNAVLGLFVSDGAEEAVLQKLVNGLDLPGKLAQLGVAGSPVSFTGFADSCMPGTCATDESFFTNLGLEVMANGTLGAPGAAFGGQWPAVYSPNTTTTPGAIVRSHTNSAGAMRDVGIVTEANLIEVLLHDMTENGNLNLSVAGTQLTPTIVPVYRGEKGPNATPFQFVVPDIHLRINDVPTTLSLKLAAGATIDPTTGLVDPTVTVQPEVEFLDCLADYGQFYALSYGQCGHANQTNAGLPTFSQVISAVAAAVADTLIDQTIGQLQVPLPSQLVPGVSLTIGTVEVENRGGHPTLIADRNLPPFGGGVLNLWSPEPYFTFTADPQGFPGSGPYTVTWQITDMVSGQQFSTAECLNVLECHKNKWMFQLGTFPGSSTKYKQAKAIVTVSRGGAQKTTERVVTHIP